MHDSNSAEISSSVHFHLIASVSRIDDTADDLAGVDSEFDELVVQAGLVRGAGDDGRPTRFHAMYCPANGRRCSGGKLRRLLRKVFKSGRSDMRFAFMARPPREFDVNLRVMLPDSDGAVDGTLPRSRERS